MPLHQVVPVDTPDSYIIHLHRGHKTLTRAVPQLSLVSYVGVASVGHQSWLRVPRID
jgi:hypothetical protein